MKSNPFTFIAAGLAAACLAPAFALEAPEDDTPPPPAGNAPAALPDIKLDAEAAPKVETAFLGVVSLEVPELLAAHIGLEPGDGIVVRSLVPGGPAALAGVAVNDVIVKVDGQPVGSPLEISKQVAGHKPGEKISLDLIHAGKPTTLDVTLGVMLQQHGNLRLHGADRPRQVEQRRPGVRVVHEMFDAIIDDATHAGLVPVPDRFRHVLTPQPPQRTPEGVRFRDDADGCGESTDGDDRCGDPQ